MSFQIHALPAEPFKSLFGMSGQELAGINAARIVVDEKPGYPCRVSLADAEVVDGEDLGEAISRMFEDRSIDYLHLHNARPGCFAARVTR
ncbi:MAG: DUF1203 domain-containing protein [Xanthomonadales bacterium]|jgi:hypothetical protein|nr:DUF1203 domain-containing protein [Xanthomonadales bacterium]